MVPEIWTATDRIFYHSGPSFSLLPLYEKMKKTPEDNIILQMYTINDSHGVYWTELCH